ncbi:hypothetical protein L228DRAFT_215864 [Xylona heveae TC161]|uniref:Phytanoyl-CoA dioxygenase n=1 Tax=Xylona heveae (strain CBS 132557 / TC161) TaxID=1328760 RepID=A0A164Z7N2_XYLHT|nr:hypothetical protein L228DRAFT_215864 [Xylona heveae TC161]KZF18788.1 hypothetical protein L228DRAFT_215864 [Xylona heveae TC161]
MPTALRHCIRNTPPGSQRESLKTLFNVLKLQYKLASVCGKHLRRLGRGLGLRTNLPSDVLRERIEKVYQQRADLRPLMTRESTYWWFRHDTRPLKYPHIDLEKFSFDARAVLSRYTGLNVDDLLTTWSVDGSIVLSGLFDWWWQSEDVIAVVHEEFEMYHHHLQSLKRRNDSGWLRNMFHSLVQQLMRQDPVYYAVHCALRPDHAWRLVSYPYYTRDACPDDSTLPRHIDLDVSHWMETGEGDNMIQGGLSIDDEDDSSTTEVLLGMHSHLKAWWKLVEERGLGGNGPNSHVTDQMYTEEDMARFECQWTSQPCKAGDVRFMSALLPHGGTGPATKRQRTLFPCFVAVADDHQKLDIEGSGTWADVAAAHRDLIRVLHLPSGDAPVHATLPIRFPPAAELMDLSALSDALVGRRRWTSPAVIWERNVVLGDDDDAALAFVQGWRKNAIKNLLITWDLIRYAERAFFGENSYFYHRDRKSEDFSMAG